MSTGLSSTEDKERVRQAIDIVDLVGNYVQLRREGRAYKAICPWHDDSRPSLQVNPERQSFRCWVCDIGGDVFSFTMKMENVTFPEALAMLAERAGISLSRRPGDSGDAADVKRTLYQAMAWAEERYHQYLLQSPDAEPARRYLADRGITDDSVKRFRLGYAPDSWSWILDEARQTRFTPQVLEQVGLVGRSERGKPYDRFRRRVLFSIRDPQSRPVALGGRVLPGATEKDGAKYVNSPETPLFSKSSMLYALDAAKDTLAKTRTAIVMEGYTDCIVAHQNGFAGSLAVLGTALGERHIKLLRRFVDRIVLVLDGDEAGRRRADQILELFIAENLDLRILTLPENLDPCDFLQARGRESFNALLEGAVDALEHRFRTATCDLDQTSGMFAVTKAVEDVLGTLARSPTLAAGASGTARLKEDQMLHRLGRRFGVEESRLRDRLQELRRGTKRATPTTTGAPPAPVEERGRMVKAERALLQILLDAPHLWAEVAGQIEIDEFRCPRRRQILATFRKLADEDVPPTFERLLLECEDPAVQSSLVDLDEERQVIGRTDPLAELRELMHVFAAERGEQAAGSGMARSRVAGPESPEEEFEAFRRLLKEKRHRQGISPPMEG